MPRAPWRRSCSCIGALWSPETGIIDSHGLHARAVGRIGRSRRHDRLRDPGRAASATRRRNGRCGSAAAIPASLRSTPWSMPAGLGAQALAPPHRRLSGRKGAAARPRQGQLFRLRRPAGVLAADLSDSDRRRTRRPRHARSRRPHAVRPRRRMDHGRELRRRSAPRRKLLRPHPHLLARPAGRRRWCRIMRASGRNCAVRAKARPIS